MFFTAQEASYSYVTLYLHGTGLWKEKILLRGWWVGGYALTFLSEKKE